MARVGDATGGKLVDPVDPRVNGVVVGRIVGSGWLLVTLSVEK